MKLQSLRRMPPVVPAHTSPPRNPPAAYGHGTSDDIPRQTLKSPPDAVFAPLTSSVWAFDVTLASRFDGRGIALGDRGAILCQRCSVPFFCSLNLPDLNLTTKHTQTQPHIHYYRT